MNDQVKIIAQRLYDDVKSVEYGFKELNANLDSPFAKENKKVIDDSISSLLFASSLILNNLEKS